MVDSICGMDGGQVAPLIDDFSFSTEARLESNCFLSFPFLFEREGISDNLKGTNTYSCQPLTMPHIPSANLRENEMFDF